MSIVCLNPTDARVVSLVENSRSNFTKFTNFSDSLIRAYASSYYTEYKKLPSPDELLDYYGKLQSLISKEGKRETDVDEKEDILDLLQSIFFLGLNKRSAGKPLTKAIINEVGQGVLDTIPEFLKAKGFTNILENYEIYKTLLIKSRLKNLNIDIDFDLDTIENQESKDGNWDKDSTLTNNYERASDEVVYLFASLVSKDTIRGLPRPLPIAKTWNTVQTALGGTTDLPTQVKKLEILALKHPWVNQIIEKLGYASEGLSENTYHNLRTSFYDSFAKANNTLAMGIIGKQTVDSIDSTLKENIRADWKSRFYNSDFVKIVKGKRVFNPDKFDEVAEEFDDLKFLSYFGITLTEPDTTTVKAAVTKIRTFFLPNIVDKNLSWLDSDKSISSTISDLLKLEAAYQKSNRALGARNADGQYQHAVGLHDYFTRKIGKLQDGIIEASNRFEKLLFKRQIVPGLMQGIKMKGEAKGYDALTKTELYYSILADMFSSEPIIHGPRTSDKKTENILKIVYDKTLTKGLNNSQYLNQIMAFDSIGEDLYKRLYMQYKEDFVKKNPEGWTAKGQKEPIHFWNELFGIEGLNANSISFEKFKSGLDTYLDNQVIKIQKELTTLGLLDSELKSKLPSFILPKSYNAKSIEEKQKDLTDLLKRYSFNTFMFGVEITNFNFGSLALVKPEEFFKRTAGPIAEGKVPRVDDSINEYIESQRPDYMSEFPKGGLMRVTISDEDLVVSPNAEEYNKASDTNAYGLDSKGKPQINTDDAQGKMVFEMYMEWKKRLNEWSPFQEQAWKKLQKGELNQKEFNDAFPPGKPVSYSILHKGAVVYIKTSVYPIHPNLVKGTLNEKLYNKMIEKGISLHLPKSGIKLSQPENLEAQFVNGEANLLDSATFDISIQDFTSQLDIAIKDKLKQLMGTQQQKLIVSNLYDNAKLTNPEFATWVQDRIDTLQEIADIEKSKLADKAGIEFDGDTPIIKNYSKIKEMLTEELMKRDLDLNTIDAINELIDEHGNLIATIDILPSRQKLMNILNSIVTNKLIKLYTNGAALVQVSQTGWELAKIENETDENIKAIETSIQFISDEAKLAYYKNNGLQFLKLDKKTGAAEIIIDARFKPYIKADGTLDERVLQSIGYRIPTQGLNSILHLKVVGFLPVGYNQMVIMPREITMQSGSDFDVDKLNLFISNVINGKYVSQDMNAEEEWEDAKLKFEKFKKFVDNYLQDRKTEFEDSVNNMDEASNKLMVAMLGDKALSNEFTREDIIEYLEDIGLNEKTLIKLGKDTEKYSSEEAKAKWIQNFKTKQLQNRIIEQNVKILEHEQSVKSLLTPNSADQLKELSKDYKPKGEMAYSAIFDPTTQVDITYQMFSAKALVGVFAAQSTHHVLGQQVGLHFKTSRPFYFDHNTVEINGIEHPTLGGIASKNKMYIITDRLGNQYLSAAVDAAKDPFLFYLGCNLDTGNVFALVERLGGNVENLVKLIRQPIIQEYLSIKSINNRLSNKRKKGESSIIRNLLKRYGQTSSEYIAEKYNGTPAQIAYFKEKRTTLGKYNDMNFYPSNPDEYNTTQMHLLDDFLYLQEAARVISKSISTSKFDTAGPGKDIVQSLTLKSKYETFVQEMNGEGIYTLGTLDNGNPAPYANIVAKTLLNVFYKSSFNFVIDMYKDMVVLLKQDYGNLRIAFEYLNNPTYGLVTKTTDEKAGTLLYGSMINMIIQQNNGFKRELFFGENSVVNKILDIQQNPKHPLNNNYIFTNFFNPEINADTQLPNIISIQNKNIDSKEADYITRSFGEIKKIDEELYNNIIEASMFQTGVVVSPVSYYRFIPNNDMLGRMKMLLNNSNLKSSRAIIKEVLANIGPQMNNIKKVVQEDGDSLGDIVQLSKKRTEGKQYINYIKTLSDGTTLIETYEYLSGEMYVRLKSKNYKSLFYNFASDITLENEEEIEPGEVEVTEDEAMDDLDTTFGPEVTVSTVTDDWFNLDPGVQKKLESKGVTKEEFNNSTKKEQQNIIKCHGR